MVDSSLPADTKFLIPHPALESFLAALLTSPPYMVPSGDAAIIAQALVLADLRGVESHGSARIPSYLARVRAGVLDPTASPSVRQVMPCVAHVDGHNGFGFVAAARGIDLACDMAAQFGIGLVGVRGSNHFGMSAWVVRRAVSGRRMMALVFTNSSPALPPYGSRTKLLGVSPIACGAPGGGGGGGDFILDMAPSVAARGKIHTALRRGEQIPADWALDAQGRPTTDPEAALDGTMLPMGGPKGSGLAIMMDVFAGVLTGSAFAGRVTGPYDASRPADVGHFLVAIRPDLFVAEEEFGERMDELYGRVVGAEPLEGVDRVYFPGEREALCEQERRGTGIPMTACEVGLLNAEAERIGCENRLDVGEEVAGDRRTA